MQGSSTTHNQQTPEVLIATVPEITLTSISLSNQRVTEYSSAQPRAPETVPGPNHIMGIPIFQLMPAFPKNPSTELETQGFSPLTAVTPITVFAGRIRTILSNWKAITKDHWVLQTVLEGYRIPLTATPVQMIPPYNLTMNRPC